MSSKPPQDPATEFRSQRHDFILHYYDMAVKDLERHLKMGWQTIATAAGAIATISAGQQHYLPIPLAVSVALIVSFWGIQNVIDANLWALRAIAFLANVEAIYFYEDDKRVFNPYAGQHPPYGLLDSLKSQYSAVLFIALMSLAFFVIQIHQSAPDLSTLLDKIVAAGRIKVGFWLLPIFLFVILAYRSFAEWKRRTADYLRFVREAPGPGMVRNREAYRSLDPTTHKVNMNDVVTGEQLQKPVLEKLEKSEKGLTRWFLWIRGLSVLVIAVLLLFVLFSPYVSYLLRRLKQ
jgi:hypothetical protein